MQTEFRKYCVSCFQPETCCYCSLIHRFDSKIHFAILIHPIESRKRIATGRMSHLCMENSTLIRGHDFTNNDRVNDILKDPKRHCVILSPGAGATNLTDLNDEARAELFPREKILTIFVLDGTWITARKMLKVSQNLRLLPKICFTPTAPSNFRIRKQPHENCYSTIEAIHHTIELLGKSQGYDLKSKRHDNLLTVFNSLVEHQIAYVNELRNEDNPSRYRRERRPSVET